MFDSGGFFCKEETMRFVALEKAKPGMVLGTDLYDLQGRIVIGHGSELTENYIKRLIEYGFSGVYIEDEYSKDIVIETSISPQLRQEGMRSIRNCDVDKCVEVAKEIVKELSDKESICLDLADLRSFDDYTYAHSVNVAVLCCALGIGMDLKSIDLENLVTAGLLHDLGKLCIPPEILNKPSRLTQEEYQIMKSHPVRSFELLNKQYNISAHIKQTVLLHHENVDGSGYPNGLVGKEQSLLVKILHVADVYDALTAQRPYKKGYSPLDAAEYLMGAGGVLFDSEVVEKFLQIIPLYPKGTELSLSNGLKGIVVENGGKHNMRPIVRLMPDNCEIDLGERENLSLTILFNDEEANEQKLKDEESRKEMIKPLKRYKVMVVDDVCTNLKVLEEILGVKYDLILLKSGNQALLHIKKNGFPDLILLDIEMPEMSGVEVAERINEITKGTVPILFVSSICDKETVLLCKEQNAVGYIAKPYKSVYIKSEIERVLNGWDK